MGEAQRMKDFNPLDRYNAIVYLFSKPGKVELSNVSSVGLDRDGKVLVISDGKETTVFPFQTVERYSFTKI
jgi:hypothetical protein